MDTEMSDCVEPLLQAHAETMSKRIVRDLGEPSRSGQRTERGGAPASTLQVYFTKRTPAKTGTGPGPSSSRESAGRLVIQPETSIKVLRQDT